MAGCTVLANRDHYRDQLELGHTTRRPYRTGANPGRRGDRFTGLKALCAIPVLPMVADVYPVVWWILANRKDGKRGSATRGTFADSSLSVRP